MDDREFADDLLPRLLGPGRDVLDPNLVAAFVDGALPPDERRRLERRIAVDPESQLLVRALRADRRRGVVRRLALAAAAVVVTASGLAWSLSRRADDPAFGPAALVAAAERLRAEAPDLFGGFHPLGEDEFATSGGAVRGGGTITWPVGLLLAPPTTLRWRAPAGATRFAVALDGEGVRFAVDATGTSTPAPALAPGRYVLRLRALDALGAQETRVSFAVATAAEQEAFRRAVARIEGAGLGAGAPVLVAHFALRRAVYAEASAAIERAAGVAASRDAAEALRRHLAATVPDAP